MDEQTRKKLNAEGAAITARTEQMMPGYAMPPMFYDPFGKPCGMGDFTYWTERKRAGDPRVLNLKTQVGEGIEVSTVWLGSNSGFMPDSPPLVFETMVFVACEPRETAFGVLESEGTEMYRYSSEDEARAGHARVVAELRSNLPDGLPKGI